MRAEHRKEIGDAHGKPHPDRLILNDRHQRSGIRRDVVAGRVRRHADDSVLRGGDDGILEIVFCRNQLRLGGKQRSFRYAERRLGALHRVETRRLFLIEQLQPFVIAFRVFEFGAALLDGGFSPFHRGLVQNRIEFVEHLPLAHDATIVEPDFQDLSRHPGDNVHDRTRHHLPRVMPGLEILGLRHLFHSDHNPVSLRS